MRTVLSVLLVSVLFVLLTILTQVGGILLLLWIGITYLLRKRYKWIYKTWMVALSFPLVYLAATFALIPLLAQFGGRTALPCFGNGSLQPLTLITCACNRQYVTPVLREVAVDAAKQMATKYHGSKLYYLDANFPFIDGFPLIPHLSHNNGKKLDLAFYYKDANSGKPLDGAPSVIGYGVFEGPKKGEIDKPKECAWQGETQYSLMGRIIPQDKAQLMPFDEERTKALMIILGNDDRVKKMFLEPHLKTRLGLTGYAKIRYQGCHSVRHDDHVHIQL